MEQNKETNLLDACIAGCQKIGKACIAVWNIGIKMLRLTWNKWWIVIPITVIAIAVGYYYARPSNRTYKVEGILVLNGPSTEATKTWYEALNNDIYYSKPHPYEALKISKEQYKHISGFKCFYTIDCNKDGIPDMVDHKNKIAASDTTMRRLNNRLCIQFKTRKPEQVPFIEQKLIQYLNNNEQFAKAYAIWHESQARFTQFEKDQIEKLDSLTSCFYFKQGVGLQTQQAGPWDGDIIVGRREIKLFLKEMDQFWKNRRLHEQDLCYDTAPIVLENHLAIQPKATNSRMKCMVIGCLLGWIIGCLIAILVEKRKEINAWMKQ